MKILMTGATGYLGSFLLAQLLHDQHEVIILKRSSSNLKRISHLLNQVNFYNVNLIQFDEIFEKREIDLIIHTATNYGRHGESDEEIYKANMLFPFRLISCALKHKTPFFLNIDTVIDKFVNAYALSKHQFLDWGKYFVTQNKINFINIKLEHMFGPHDDESKFITGIIKKCLRNEVIDLTAGEQQRDFIYIEDIVIALMTIIDTLSQKNSFSLEHHIGSGKTIAIKELVKLIHKHTCSHSKLNFGAIPYRKNELMHSRADISSLKKLGWKPKLDLETALQHTIKLEQSV